MMHSTYAAWYFCLFIVLILLVGCNRPEPESQPVPATNASVVFNDKVQAEYAEGFRITYHDNYKLLEILNPYQDRTDTLRYILKPRGMNLNQSFDNAQVVDIPVRSMIATSTTHIGLTEILDANEIVTGMVAAKYVYSPEIKQRFENGELVSFPEGEFNKEEALALAPDMIMVSAGQSSQFDDYRVLMNSGIDVLINSEWLETTPLGKAEWVKVMGALLNREAQANEEFEKVEKEYNRLKNLVKDIEEKPLVINNLPYKGAWFVSGGESFTAQYLKDAGANYPWFEKDQTGGLREDFESVYEIGLQADIWLNPGAVTSIEELLAKDSRFEDFKSVQQGEVYNNNRRMSPSGGNDFWESGVVHPERVLADLIHILHPEILPGHNLYYYQKITSDE